MLRFLSICAVAGGMFGSLTTGVVEARDYYVSDKATAGRGTTENPFGLPDLQSIQNPEKVSNACAALHPGDTLWFKGGTYEFTKTTKPGLWHYQAHLWSARSGEPGKPISFRAMPGEKVVLKRVSGGQPLLGSRGSSDVRFEGFVLEAEGQGMAKMIWLSGDCKRVEVAYCKIIGNFDNFDTPHNPAVIFCDRTEGTWMARPLLKGSH